LVERLEDRDVAARTAITLAADVCRYDRTPGRAFFLRAHRFVQTLKESPRRTSLLAARATRGAGHAVPGSDPPRGRRVPRAAAVLDSGAAWRHCPASLRRLEPVSPVAAARAAAAVVRGGGPGVPEPDTAVLWELAGALQDENERAKLLAGIAGIALARAFGPEGAQR
jgi:hypothetical protein